MMRSNKCQLLADSSNVATSRAVFNFLCDCIEYEKNLECSFAQPSKMSPCRFARDDYCICLEAKIQLLQRHILKANTILGRLKKPDTEQGVEILPNR